MNALAMIDRELLELAAKAAGIEQRGWCMPGARTDGWHGMYTGDGESGAYTRWNPLTDDGDALRLAVKLGLHLFTRLPGGGVPSSCSNGDTMEAHWGDPYAATRRAIVRAAANIGRRMS